MKFRRILIPSLTAVSSPHPQQRPAPRTDVPLAGGLWRLIVFCQRGLAKLAVVNGMTIHRGDDVRHTMSRAEHDLTLPALINRGLVTTGPDGALLDPGVAASRTLART